VTWGAAPAPSGTVTVGTLNLVAVAASGSATLAAGNALVTNPAAQALAASGGTAQIQLGAGASPTATPTRPATPPPAGTTRLYLPVVTNK
jgi:hypothetical protein